MIEINKSVKDQAKDLKFELEIFKNESNTDSNQNKKKSLKDLNDLNKRFENSNIITSNQLKENKQIKEDQETFLKEIAKYLNFDSENIIQIKI